MKRTVYIYTLTDPRDGLVHYVGRTNNPQRRKYEHQKRTDIQTSRSYLPWRESLIAVGLVPIFKVVEEVVWPGIVAEKMWMKELRSQGHPLVNSSNYVPGKVSKKTFRGIVIKSDEQIKKEQGEHIRARWRKWWDSLTPEQKSDNQRKKLDNGGKERMIAKQKGRKLPHDRALLSAKNGRKALENPESRRIHSEKIKAFWASMSAQGRSEFAHRRFEIAKQKGRTGFIKVIP